LMILNHRVEEVSRVLSKLGLDVVLKIEDEDPQYLYINKVKEIQGRGVSLVLAVLTALVSYRLALSGEEWWRCFYTYFTKSSRLSSLKDITKSLLHFLDVCEGAKVQREAKKRRILKVVSGCNNILEGLLQRPETFTSKYKDLLRCEARSLSQQEHAKTLIFSIKMGYYAIKDLIKTPVFSDLPLPVDVRIACITYSSKMILTKSYKDLVKVPKLVQDVWSKVSKSSGIPTLHLDALLWRIGWIPRAYDVNEARVKVKEFLERYTDKERAELIAKELVLTKCV
jgi:DNA-(apurinic or apyrimidinic site) lyase